MYLLEDNIPALEAFLIFNAMSCLSSSDMLIVVTKVDPNLDLCSTETLIRVSFLHRPVLNLKSVRLSHSICPVNNLHSIHRQSVEFFCFDFCKLLPFYKEAWKWL